MAETSAEGRWLLLIHQIPPKPDYFRVKIWRRLQRLGAVAIKNSVYVLPKNDQTQEDFQWVLREIVEGHGEASLCEARFVEGLSDDQVEALFQAARGAEYDQIAEEARRLAEIPLPDGKTEEMRRKKLEIDLVRLKRRLAEAVAIDFFGAPGREAVEGLVSGLEARMTGKNSTLGPDSAGTFRREDLLVKPGLPVREFTSTAWQVPGLFVVLSIRMPASSLFRQKDTGLCLLSYASICSRQSSRMRATDAR